MSRIALAGGSGFVGAALRRHWASRGVEVVPLVRRPAEERLRRRGRVEGGGRAAVDRARLSAASIPLCPRPWQGQSARPCQPLARAGFCGTGAKQVDASGRCPVYSYLFRER